jgi:hypothetical protein
VFAQEGETRETYELAESAQDLKVVPHLQRRPLAAHNPNLRVDRSALYALAERRVLQQTAAHLAPLVRNLDHEWPEARHAKLRRSIVNDVDEHAIVEALEELLGVLEIRHHLMRQDQVLQE